MTHDADTSDISDTSDNSDTSEASEAPGASAGESASDSLPLRARALLLDMDGTLIDSGPAVERCWNILLRELGTDLSFGHAMHGRPARQILAEAVPSLDEEGLERAHRRIEELEIADAAGIRTLPGSERVIGELERASAQLGRRTWTIVTSCTRPLFVARWSRTGLPTPDGLVTADQVTRGKPDPEAYLLGAERVGIAPSDCLVVEDSEGGLRAGLAAGSRTVAVTSTTPASSLAPLASVLLTSLDDVEVRVEGEELVLARRGG